MEEQVLHLWRQRNVFQRSMSERLGGPEYVFYEGPPTANGRPGIHHVLARAFKEDVWVFILIAVGEVHQVIANLTVDLVPRAITAHDVETHNISRIAGVLHLELSVEPRRCCAKRACPLRKQWTVHSAMEGRSSDHAE